ncbi:cyanophycin synthetase [Natranaerobius trueperi]|uniref:Cyanophycin synthetase n=1 Tax=Natranaerobius trueperi TaxID=759412 RepID=A0A226BXD9_9FIRM|nr:cyanophycin synthetase [Natranaerobius trueperi]OWZ83656.1 cyanophycin synthetase [Natranaerobius trueperi]
MEIRSVKKIQGKNIYSHHPVLIANLHLGELKDVTSDQFLWIHNRLKEILPDIREHRCSRGYPGGFLERVREGTLAGHIVEHVTLELMNLAGIGTYYGTTRRGDEPGVYKVVIEQVNEAGAELALRCAVEVVEKMINGEKIEIEKIICEIKEEVNETKLGPSTEAILNAAKEKNIPYISLDDASMYQLGTGIYQKRIQATVTDKSSVIGVDVACDKTQTNKVLDDLGIPVPYGKVAREEDEAVKVCEEIGYPTVIKPRDGNQGKGVTLNITTEKEARTAFKVALGYGDEVIVEQHIEGKHYRLLVVGDKLVAGAQRIPAHVIGDGEHSIRELVDLENRNPLRGAGHEKPLSKIQLDPVVNMVLARNNMTMNYVPKLEETVYLRESANLSTGGTSIDVTDIIPEETKETAIRAVKVIGLDIGGVDLVTKDISKPMESENSAIIEINAAPGIRMHEHPTEGKPRPTGKYIIDHLFPDQKDVRAPIISVTGTNGKTTTVRAIDYILRSAGKKVGTTTTEGIYINGKQIISGDTTGPKSAKTILKDPQVEACVFETARGGLAREGLGYLDAKVAIVTNIDSDHIGQDGIETINDLIYVKSLVVEAVEKEGKVILNADDKYVKHFLERARAEVIFFSKESNNYYIRKHLSIGGKALFIKNGDIIFAYGNVENRLGKLEELPLTLGGIAEHNVENALASLASVIGFGLKSQDAYEYLQELSPSYDNTPGRCNIFRCENKLILVDYGHNPAGIEKVMNLAKNISKDRLVSVVGVPGDRNNDLIKETGEVVKGYRDCLKKVIVKEDEDLRGRKAGEVADLLVTSLETEMSEELLIEKKLCETEAIKKAVQEASEQELVVVFYEKLDSFFEAAKELGIEPTPVPIDQVYSNKEEYKKVLPSSS